jgi:hypothetical protein
MTVEVVREDAPIREVVWKNEDGSMAVFRSGNTERQAFEARTAFVWRRDLDWSEVREFAEALIALADQELGRP